MPYLAEAVARDGNFAPAHASLAEANIRIALRAPLQQRTHSFEIAEASVRRALVLEPTLPAAHAMQGWVYLFRDWDWQRARVELETAVRLDPHDANARSYYATYLRAVGRTADAITERRLARETDPLRVELTSLLGGEYLFARRYQDAAREFRNALELEPGYLHALDGLADALGRLGATEARAAQIRLLAARGDLASANTFADRYRRGGLPPAMGWLDRVLLDTYRRSPNATPWDLAYMHARMGHVDAAFAHLEDAFRQRDSGLLQLRTDPDLDPIRSDPRFDQLVRRLGMSE